VQRLLWTRCSRERVANVQKVEFSEVPVVRVERGDAVLPKQRCEMSVGYVVSTGRHLLCHFAVQVPQAVFFGERADVQQVQKRLDVVRSFLRPQRVCKDRRVGRDAEMAHHGRPPKIKDVRTFGRSSRNSAARWGKGLAVSDANNNRFTSMAALIDGPCGGGRPPAGRAPRTPLSYRQGSPGHASAARSSGTKMDWPAQSRCGAEPGRGGPRPSGQATCLPASGGV
jgi:hypothetical protein